VAPAAAVAEAGAARPPPTDMRRAALKLWKSESGSVAPIVAISLFALISAAGIGFDYARMAGMHTELQNAADHAALAAAAQLDGKTNARSRATSSAQGLIGNLALFTNDPADTDGRSVTMNGTNAILFYQDKAKTTLATSDEDAHFVLVTVDTKKAFYALTPIVAAISSGPIAAKAFAGITEGICKVPPLMICNPDEAIGNTDPDITFDPAAYVGDGIRLVGDGSYAPGNFGFLQSALGNGASNLLKGLAWNDLPINCSQLTGVSTQTGLDASVIDGLNTRFDVDANGNSCPSGGTCSPSINTRKDLVRGNQCGITGNGWQEVDASNGNYQSRRYRPTDRNPYPTTVTPPIMGFPRDACHAWSIDGDCTVANGRIGDGSWDRDAYFRSNYGWSHAAWMTNTGLSATTTRYQVYLWEINHSGLVTSPQATTGSTAAYSRPVCLAPGLTPGPSTVDRRRVAAAVINCQALNIKGSSPNVPVARWIDLFLVEPSFARSKCSSGSGCNVAYTSKTDVYVEVIGETGVSGTGSTLGQVVRRSVPYLIE
jgi:Flp pilus assembly protein TadG